MSKNTCPRISVVCMLVDLEISMQLCFLTRQVSQMDVESVGPIIVIPLTKYSLAMHKIVPELTCPK